MLLTSVSFVSENLGWSVGVNGRIIYTNNGGVTFIKNETTQLTEFALEQNYPTDLIQALLSVGSRQSAVIKHSRFMTCLEMN